MSVMAKESTKNGHSRPLWEWEPVHARDERRGMG